MLGDSLRRRHGAGSGEEPKAERPPRPKPRPRRAGGRRFTVWHWLLAAVIVLGGSFGVGFLLSTQVLFPRPETAGEGAPVPPLYGLDRPAAEAAIREAGLEVGEVRALASMDVEPGRVLAQAPVPGQQLRPGAAVAFAVSAGPPELRVPPLRGMRTSSARELLESAGFSVSVQEILSDELPPGVVAGSAPEAGVARRLPADVTLRVSAGAPAVPDTLEGTSPVGVPLGTPRGGQ